MSETKTELDREAVLAWLAEHPDALSQEQELVSRLRVDMGDGRQIVGLQQYRQEQLQQENRKLKQELARFEQLVLDNEKLLHRVHQWVLRMLDALDKPQLIAQVIQGLKKEFSAEVIALHVVHLPEEVEVQDQVWLQTMQDAAVQNLSRLKAAKLGRLPDSQKEALFGPLAPQVQSAVILPMQAQGVLAIGSSDPLHYQSGMGTELLDFASQCLMRLLRVHG